MAWGFFLSVSDFLWQWRWLLGAGMLLLLVDQFRRIDVAERGFVLAMLLYFFLTIVAYWLLKPIKKAAFVAFYKVHPATLFGSTFDPAQMELLAKEANVAVALAASLLLAWLSRRLGSLRYSLSLSALCLGSLLLLRIGADDRGAPYVWAFYLFGDFFVTTMVAVFFSYLHEHTDVPGSRRIYGLVGLGGVLGGVVGSTAVSGVSNTMGIASALDFCILAVLGIASIQWAVARLVPEVPREVYAPTFNLQTDGSLWAAISLGGRVVFSSRHLTLVAAVLFFYELASVIMDYQFTSAVTLALAPAQYRAYFSSVFAFSNLFALLIQLLLTTWVLRRIGPQLALLIMPLAVFAGSALYLALPVLLVASLLNTADSAFAYSIQQTAREAAYVPLARDEKYEAKLFIDVFWLRFAKGMAVALSLLASLALAVEQAYWLGYFVLALALTWIVTARYLSSSLLCLSRKNVFPENVSSK